MVKTLSIVESLNTPKFKSEVTAFVETLIHIYNWYSWGIRCNENKTTPLSKQHIIPGDLKDKKISTAFPCMGKVIFKRLIHTTSWTRLKRSVRHVKKVSFFIDKECLNNWHTHYNCLPTFSTSGRPDPLHEQDRRVCTWFLYCWHLGTQLSGGHCVHLLKCSTIKETEESNTDTFL